MKVITLLNEKGGVGKTTLAVHIAAGLAIRGHRVMLIDSDGQGSATIMLGMEKAPSFHDLMVRGASWADVARRIPPERYMLPDDASDIAGSLFLLPGNAESRTISEHIGDAAVLLNRVQELDSIIDFVVIDTSPTPSLLHGAIYLATDAMIYPTRCEALSFDGLRESVGRKSQADPYRTSRGRPEIETLGIVPTMVMPRTVEHSEGLELLKRTFPGMVWEPVDYAITWAEAAGWQRTVFAHAPRSKAAHQAWRLVNRIGAYVETR